MQQRYGDVSGGTLFYAVGDGNHSLATAKSIWETIKSSLDNADALRSHPARYALVELVNIHDQGLLFEAIHRVLFNVPAEGLTAYIQGYFQQQGLRVRMHAASSREAAAIAAEIGSSELHRFGWVTAGGSGIIEIEQPLQVCATGTLQDCLDAYLQKNPQAAIDYVHGDAVVTGLGGRPDNAGFYLPSIAKSDLFRTILIDGALAAENVFHGRGRGEAILSGVPFDQGGQCAVGCTGCSETYALYFGCAVHNKNRSGFINRSCRAEHVLLMRLTFGIAAGIPIG